MKTNSSVWTVGVLALGAGLATSLYHGGTVSARAAAAQEAKPQTDEIAAFKVEVARLKSIVPDQAHAMSDVGQHFTNLWFAGDSQNWPLAQFFSDETRSHLRWAVRIIPKRKDAENREIDLQGILTGLETSSLKDLDQSIKDKDKARFTAAYKVQLEACMTCHRTSNKPYIKLRIPERPDAGILEFRPD